MKKIFLFLIIFLLSVENIQASTNVYTRTSSDYLVPSDIKVDASNRNAILNTPAVNAKEKVYDFADLLTNEQEFSLYNNINYFINDSSYDLVIVTIDDNPKYSAMEYADDFFDYNDFGFNSSRDGVLVLIDMDTREVYISTSGMAIKMYSDYRIESIIDAGYYNLTNGNYYGCLSEMINEIENYYDLGFPSENNNLHIDENGNPYYIRKMPYLMIFLAAGTFCLIVTMILYYKTRSVVKKHNIASYINMENTNINKNEIFLTTYTSKIRRQTSSSSGGGGGGSSFHRSSSGRSHGGGGRRF